MKMVGEKVASRMKSLDELNKAYISEVEKKGQQDQAISEETASKLKSNEISSNLESKALRISQVRTSKSVIVALGIVALGIMVIIAICLFIGSRDPVRSQLSASEKIVPVILTSEEQEKWMNMEAQKGKFYIELNTRIKVDDTKAYIRLINPIYSAYTFSIQMWEKGDKTNLLYASEKLMPGTILEAVNLTRPLTSEEHEVVVNYVVYDEAGEESDSYPVDVKLIKEDITVN